VSQRGDERKSGFSQVEIRFIMTGMNAESIREMLNHRPFLPFEVHMTNGEVYRVTHPEQVLIAGARLLIYYPENDRLVYCSLLHVANVITQQSAA
jgi:hypothetical protein